MIKKQPQDYLNNKIDSNNHRYQTFECSLELLSQMNAQTIVETGTARDGASNYAYDGGSTLLFSEWARDHGAELFSVDISQTNLSIAKQAVASHVPDYLDKIHFICNDSIPFLGNFNKTIDFLYLDSYDYDSTNPAPSQQHHLKEIEAAYPFLIDKSVVMIDDCNITGGGKGTLAILYLLERGWKLLKSSYQVILVRS